MIVCLTGQIGSGKTTCLKYIKSLNINTFEMDQYIHEIYKINHVGYNLIKDTFGKQYVNDKEVDRKKLGTLVFNDINKLNKLNDLMLPVMKNKVLELKQQYQNDLIVVELAIFINHQKYFKNIFDYIIQLIPNFNIQNQKLKDLSWFKNNKKIKDPIQANIIPNSIVINNGSTEEKLNQKISKVIHKIINKNKM